MTTKHPHLHVPKSELDWVEAFAKFNSLMDTTIATLHLQKSYHYTEPKLGYVVPMEKKSNRKLDNPSTLTWHFLNFLEESGLQQGYEYFVYPEFPRKALSIVVVLQHAKLLDGYDVDEDGFVSYTEDEE